MINSAILGVISSSGPFTPDPPACDPNFANVVLLAHFDGSAGSTILTDSSTYSRTVSAFGTGGAVPSLVTTEKVFGTASVLKPSGTGNIGISYASELNLADKIFTLEGWARVTPGSSGANLSLIDFRRGEAFDYGWVVYANRASESINIYDGPTDSNTASTSNVIPFDGTWFFFCIRRTSGGLLKIEVDGSEVLSTSYNPRATAPDGIRIGLNQANGDAWPGNFDEWRWTVGVDRYPGEPAPVPTSAYPDEAC